MKKIKSLILLLFLFFPIMVKADKIDYDITNYYIQADLQTNGDMKVTEVIVLDGYFNGYIREILYRNEDAINDKDIYNAQGFELLNIEAMKVNQIDFDIIKNQNFETLISGQASQGGYRESNYLNGNEYQMFYKGNYEKVAFRITYLLKNVVIAHEDVAELYWMFIGKNYPDAIHDLQIKVNLPNIDTTTNFRAWAHGDLSGEIQLHDQQYILATVAYLEPYNSVEIRSTFDLSLVSNDLIKKTHKSAFKEIIEEETEYANIANQERKKMKVKYYSLSIATIFWYIAFLISGIYIYIKYDKEYKSTFNLKYNREFIDDYSVEVVDYLFHKNITPNALSASIMNLIYKKNIRIEEITTNKKKKDYIFYLNNSDNVTPCEEYLLKFLFKIVGNESSFTTIDLQNYAKNKTTCESFLENYTRWKNKVLAVSQKENFFEDQAKARIIGFLFFLTSIFLNILRAIFLVENNWIIVTLVLGFLFFIYTLSFNKRTKKGNLHYAKWKAFKNFLNDFGTFDNKELPEIMLWERYMVYATIFGLADKVSKVMNIKIKEMQDVGILTPDYIPTYTDWYIFHSIHNNFTHAISENNRAITALRANSSTSSGSGFGGGFSSGGGFGGGGGGGHGF